MFLDMQIYQIYNYVPFVDLAFVLLCTLNWEKHHFTSEERIYPEIEVTSFAQ